MKLLAQTAPSPANPTPATPAEAAKAPAEAVKAPAETAEAPKAPATEQKTPATEQKAPATEQKAPATEQKAPAPVEATTVPAPKAATDVTGSVGVPSGPPAGGEKPAESIGVPSQVVFFLGVVLMGMFLWYFGTESSRRKRVVGSILAVAVTAGSLWFLDMLGVNMGIEIRGGVAMTIKIEPGIGQDGQPKKVTAAGQQAVIKVLQKRLDTLGTKELAITAQGEDRIFLEVPGETDPTQIEKEILKVAKLDFHIVQRSPVPLAQIVSGAETVPGMKAFRYADETDENGDPKPHRGYELLKIKPDMSGKHVSGAFNSYGAEGPEIHVSFDMEGANIMAALTQEHMEEQLAIVMDGEIISAPVIRAQFSTGCLISGSFTDREALALATSLENPLENPIKIESANKISPTMGKEAFRQGILAGVTGLILSLIFIVLYYRFSGLVAVIGLAVNTAIILGAMALFKFTLTLPGIAGIILTIGVAIDANVLIFERLREELQAGKTIEGAIKLAYEKAFSAIFDSNLTSLITSIILFAVATGTVKGFAITLTIGILASLFSALIVTRVCFSWATDSGFLKMVKFLDLAPKRAYDFLGVSRACLTFSAIAVVVSLIVVAVRDPRGVDLRGGDKLEIRSTEGLSVAKIQDVLKGADLGKTPIVQSQTPVGAEGEFFTVRSEFGTAPQVIEALEKATGNKITDTTTESIGSAVGSELLKTSAIALGLGLLGIMIYVTLRYEFAFAFGALAALIHDLIVTCGFLAITGQEISLITVSALLTIAGYSINDTIVVFDRVREGLQTKRGDVKDVMNHCLNATLGRTILTGLTTLMTVVTILIFAGSSLANFALTLLVGILYGTYSSIWVASPIVLWWVKRTGTNLRREVLDTEAARVAVTGGGKGTAPAA